MAHTFLTARLFSPAILPPLFGTAAAALILLTLAGDSIVMPLVAGLLALVAVSLLGCTLLRFRALRASTLTIHSGLFLILAAGLAGGGYTATANLYEGDSVTTFFRWDRQSSFSPGFALRLTDIRRQWYPADIKLGLLQNGRKKALLTARTGARTTADGLTIILGEFDPEAAQLAMEIHDGQGRIAHGRAGLHPLSAGGYAVQLVAFQTPQVRNVSAHLQILDNGTVLHEGTVSINSPLRWDSLRFCLTALDTDDAGNLYAGLQITSNPGWGITAAGFLITTCGLLLHLPHLFRRRKSANRTNNRSPLHPGEEIAKGDAQPGGAITTGACPTKSQETAKSFPTESR